VRHALGDGGAVAGGIRPRPAPSRTSAPALRRRCRELRAVLGARVPDAELAPYQPGGAENPFTGRDGWLEYLIALRVFAARVGGGGAPAGDVDPAVARQAAREVIVARTLAKAPVLVRLASGREVAVYPKSYHAAEWCTSNDAQVRYIVAQALAHADDLRVLAYAPLARSLHVRLWAWVVTTPGEGLPFDEATPAEVVEADLPEHLARLAPEDLVALGEAWATVQHLRPAVVAKLFPPDDPRASGLPLSGFIGACANEFGRPASELMRRWTVGELFAQAVTAAQSAREAEGAARDRADRAGGA
jgi:hypothetical protein